MIAAAYTTRYEFKYIVEPAVAEAIRAYVRGYLPPDPYMPPGDPRGYQIHSLYLDARRELVLCRQTQDGLKNRYKLRIRFYDKSPEAPVFIEVKQRTTDAIQKYRVSATKQAAAHFLDFGVMPPDGFITRDGPSLHAWNKFLARCRELDATGSAFVSYRRAAFVSNVSKLRVTLDCDLTAHPYYPGSGLTMVGPGESAQSGFVVVEMKFTDRCPPWMRQMASIFGMQRTSFPKYVRCCKKLASTKSRLLVPAAEGRG